MVALIQKGILEAIVASIFGGLAGLAGGAFLGVLLLLCMESNRNKPDTKPAPDPYFSNFN
jgi:hypothetical protein